MEKNTVNDGNKAYKQNLVGCFELVRGTESISASRFRPVDSLLLADSDQGGPNRP